MFLTTGGDNACPEPEIIIIDASGNVDEWTSTPKCVYPPVERTVYVPFERIDHSELTVIAGNAPADASLGETLVIEPYARREVRIVAKAKDKPVDAQVSSCDSLRLVVTLYPQCHND